MRFIVVLLLWTVSLVGHAEPDKKNVVLGVVVFPPLTIIDPVSGQCTGPGISITEKIMREANLPLESFCVPAARLYKMVSEGIIDLTINVKSTQALQGHMHFLDTPFSMLKLVVLRNPGIERGFSIAGIRGFDYHGKRQTLNQSGYTFVDVPSAVDAINLFLHQRTGFLITYLGPYQSFIASSQHPIPDKVESISVDEIPTYYGVYVKSSRRTEIETAINDYINRYEVKKFVSAVMLP